MLLVADVLFPLHFQYLFLVRCCLHGVRMELVEVRPDVITYNALISSCEPLGGNSLGDRLGIRLRSQGQQGTHRTAQAQTETAPYSGRPKTNTVCNWGDGYG